MSKRHKLFSCAINFFLFFTVTPAVSDSHIIVVPQCLLKQLHAHYKILSTSSPFSLLEVDDEGINQLTEAKKFPCVISCGDFMDLTQSWNDFSSHGETSINRAKAFLVENISTRASLIHNKYQIKYFNEVNALIQHINSQVMWSDLATLTRFPDRYVNSYNGLAALNWLKNKMENLIQVSGRKDVSIYTIPTGQHYKQPSLIIKIGNNQNGGIVLGAHIDTFYSKRELKPGADDDGSGVVTLIEVAEKILNSNLHLKKPVYLIWYAGEELGLLGSESVVRNFKKKKIPIDAVLQLDMTSYIYRNNMSISINTDYVNKDLTQFLATLIQTYVKRKINFSKCNFACSDHASWFRQGYVTVFPFEGEKVNPYLHTARDRMEILSVAHMVDFTKLCIAFAIELAEPL